MAVEAETGLAEEGDSLKGFLLALSAYLLWGILPLYLALFDSVGLIEVLAHRVIWSVPVALLILFALGRTRDLRRALVSPRLLAMAGLTAALVTVNWGIYLYAIQTDQVLDAALGYFINPLFSVFLAAVFLREKLSRWQWLAVALAVVAVLVLTGDAGRLPLISLGLPVSWGFYAFAKRALPIGPNQGFTLEVILLSPLALAYLAWLWWHGTLSFGYAGAGMTGLLLGAGVITAVPLMLYANGAKRLTLSTMALMQYIVPTLVFLTAVLVFGEAFEGAKRVAFPMIWAALVLYTIDTLRRRA